jgi:hypothetical protein
MRYLPAARSVILDADTEHRQTIVAALTELGLMQLLQASDLVEAAVFGMEGPVDLCVVNARGP